MSLTPRCLIIATVADHIITATVVTTSRRPRFIIVVTAAITSSRVIFRLVPLSFGRCAGGAANDIYQVLQQPLTEPAIQYISHGLLRALDFCHANSVIHRDIKVRRLSGGVVLRVVALPAVLA